MDVEADGETSAITSKSVKPSEGDSFVHPEGGWGWFVCFTAFIVNGVVFGTINNTGILLVAMSEEFGANETDITTKTAVVGCLSLAVTLGLCTVAGVVSDRIGIRQAGLVGGTFSTIGMLSSAFATRISILWLTYGVLLGIGFAFLYNPSLVILGHYFRRHHGMVNGIYTTGGCVFAIGLSFGLRPLFKEVGFRYTMIALTVLAAMTLPCALAWKPLFKRHNSNRSVGDSDPHQSSRKSFKKRLQSYLNMDIWKNKNYTLWILAESLNYASYSVVIVHLVNAVKIKLPDINYDRIVLCLTLSGSVSQLTCGKISDFRWASRVRIQQGAFLLNGLALMCVPWLPNYAWVVVFTVILGLCHGVFISMTGPITSDIVGHVNSSQALGFFVGILAIPTTAFPILIGFVYDRTQSYDIAFHVMACAPILAAILMLAIPSNVGQDLTEGQKSQPVDEDS